MAPGMEKLRDLGRQRIDARQVRPLAKIAIDAREREIFGVIGTTVLSRYDVLDVVRG